MNTGLHDSPEDRFDAFLDGTLEGDARREMQSLVTDDPALQREVELQTKINVALHRCCKAPDVERMLRKAGGSTPSGQRAGTLRRIGRMAAMILIGVTAALAVFWFAVPGGRRTNVPSYEVIGIEASYQQLVGDGFKPEWRCETDEEFASTYRTQLGQALVLGQLPADIQMLGLSYSPAFSYNTIALLARVEGQPVIVYADRVESVEGVSVRFSDPAVHVFQRRVGDLVLYEVTEQDRPSILGAMLIPEGEPGCNLQ